METKLSIAMLAAGIGDFLFGCFLIGFFALAVISICAAAVDKLRTLISFLGPPKDNTGDPLVKEHPSTTVSPVAKTNTQYDSPKPADPKLDEFVLAAARNEAHQMKIIRNFLVGGLVFFTVMIYACAKPNRLVLPPLPQVSQPVDVSVYSRASGATVNSYHRALPGERELNNQAIDRWAKHCSVLESDYSSKRNAAICWSLGFLLIGGTVLHFLFKWTKRVVPEP